MKKCYLMLISIIFIISFGNQAVAMHRVLQAVQSPTGCCLAGSVGCGLLSWWAQKKAAHYCAEKRECISEKMHCLRQVDCSDFTTAEESNSIADSFDAKIILLRKIGHCSKLVGYCSGFAAVVCAIRAVYQLARKVANR